MDIQQLRVFRSAAEEGGFTRASEQLHLSQSTVSQHIKQLEQDLGCSLFMRVGKRVFITEAGTLLLQYTEKIFRDLKNAEMAVREISALQRGTVRLGTGASTLIYRLPDILSEYKRFFPNIELTVTTGTTEFLMHAVKSRHLDLAVVMSAGLHPGVGLRPLGREELVLVLHRNHPLAKRTLRPADLASLRFILYEKNSAMQTVIDHYFEEMGVTIQRVMELENIEAIKSLVRAGLGASVLPLCAVAESAQPSDLRVVRIKGFRMFRDLGLITADTDFLPKAITELASRLVAGLS